MSTLSEITRELLKKSKLKIKKRLGQHFLIDKDILQRILAAAELAKEDLAIEIGTGLGTFTKELAERVAKVITVEIDQKLLEVARDFLKDYKNIEFIREDILEVDLSPYPQAKIVANLPYYITTPIIEKLIEAKPKLIVLTVQREVAERIVSKPASKDYGSFSIFVQYHTIPEIISFVPKSAFLPRPEVSSAILKLTPRKGPAVEVKDEKLFFEIVRAAFQQRRKTLKKALSSKFGLSKVESALSQAQIDPKRRGETLSLAEFASICNALSSMI